ncbi:hypothetical protein B0H13DRAFT_1867034 [Mycena leptocephala]|nr:hypothetical protein B0H13DRAFT_1867034 [Mycena leptocephala]
MGEKRRREVMDYVLVPKSELDGEIQASNRGEWGPGVMQNGFEQATSPETADNQVDAPGGGGGAHIARGCAERRVVKERAGGDNSRSGEESKSCIMKRYEPGTVPFVLQAPADECLKCQGRCTCDKCAKIRDDIYQPPEHRGRSSGQTRYPAYSDLEQVVIKEPMVYYATMYDCHTSAPVAETHELFQEAAVEWLIATDQPIDALTHQKFKVMIEIAARETQGVTLPNRAQTRAEIKNLFYDQMDKLKIRLHGGSSNPTLRHTFKFRHMAEYATHSVGIPQSPTRPLNILQRSFVLTSNPPSRS